MDKLSNLFVDPLAFGRILFLELGQSLFVGGFLALLHRAEAGGIGGAVLEQIIDE